MNQQPMSMTEQLMRAQESGKPIFDRMRSMLEDDPEKDVRQGTVEEVIPMIDRSVTYVVHTIRTDRYHGFIQAFTAEGMVRLYMPPKVMQALYRQHAAIVKKAKSERAKRGAEKRRAEGHVPFVRRQEPDDEPELPDDPADEELPDA